MEQVEVIVGGISIEVSKDTAAKGIAFMVEKELKAEGFSSRRIDMEDDSGPVPVPHKPAKKGSGCSECGSPSRHRATCSFAKGGVKKK